MVPSVAQRGSSFKGAGLYYLHDKGRDTAERVAWTTTHNVPTQDPEKGLNWMAYTATHAEEIKARNGTSRAGAKSKGKPVYAYSLAWHESDKPSREEMETAARSSLEKLGLQDHETVIVAHQDQKHPHVHIITNLVHPQTGKTQSPKMDYTRLSKWAEQHDRDHGREHCPLRRENNAKRYKEEARTQFVKHNDKRHERAAQFQSIADRSKTGQQFRDQLEEQGYTLAQGHKGRLVVVDNQGEITNLTRQLKHKDGKGYRAKDLRAKLDGVELKSLPQAGRVQSVRQGADRDGYAAEQDDKLFAAALKADRAEEKGRKEQEAWKEQTDGNRGRAVVSRVAADRQEQRHKEAKETRKPFREGGHVRQEFNAEIEDAGRAADEKRIKQMLKSVKEGKQKAAEQKRQVPETKTAREFDKATHEAPKAKTPARNPEPPAEPSRTKTAAEFAPAAKPKPPKGWSKGKSWSKGKGWGKSKDGPSRNID